MRLVLLGIGLVLGGCGVETALIGVGASAAQAGVTMIDKGELRSFEMARYDDVVRACYRAGTDLALDLKNDDRNDKVTSMFFRDETGDKITVRIERRTERVTFIKVDVGSFGKIGLGSLFMHQVWSELADSDAYLEDWDRADPRDGGVGASPN